MCRHIQFLSKGCFRRINSENSFALSSPLQAYPERITRACPGVTFVQAGFSYGAFIFFTSLLTSSSLRCMFILPWLNSSIHLIVVCCDLFLLRNPNKRFPEKDLAV